VPGGPLNLNSTNPPRPWSPREFLVKLFMSPIYLILQIYKLLLYLFLLEYAVKNHAVTFQARSHVNTKILPFRENSHGRAGNRTRDLMISSQRL